MIGTGRALWVVGAAGLLVAAVQTPLIATAEFSPDRGLWIALNWVIGVGFVLVGAYAWLRRPDNRVGALMVATGFAWFLSVLGHTEPPLLFTVGVLFDSLFVAVAIHLLLAFPSGRLESTVDRWLLAAVYAAVTLGYLPTILFWDPATTGCVGCPDNVFLISSDPSLTTTSGDVLAGIGIALLLAVFVRLAVRWRGSTALQRRAITPVYAAGAALMLSLAALLQLQLARASYGLIEDVFYGTMIPFGLVPYLFLAGLARAQMLRGGAVGRLVASLGETLGPGELRDALCRALGDPSLELAYWLTESEHYVDAKGHRVALPRSGSGRAASPVTLDGRPVAAIIHDPLLLDDPDLVQAVGAAAALALEKERLDAELRARVEELQESQARLLAVGFAERRRMERDLHDGAQQRLVSLALDLRLARSALREEPERAERLLDGADEELSRALEELRELARGLHPAVLSDRGLEAAVQTLATRAPLPVDVDARMGQVPEAVELAAYFVVSEALTNVAKYSAASSASVRVGRDDGSVVVEVSDDGVGGADPERGSGLRGLGDRLSALGGKLEVDSRSGAGTTVRARIPCE
ncbi:MAG TPA: histidine kinase [Solirubrobacterales bacterium]|nr:histidine kinase [Solirubrobacterales bacterium]